MAAEQRELVLHAHDPGLVLVAQAVRRKRAQDVATISCALGEEAVVRRQGERGLADDDQVLELVDAAKPAHDAQA
eukprot:8211695-Alexandrium_andersonii.AAC.2